MIILTENGEMTPVGYALVGIVEARLNPETTAKEILAEKDKMSLKDIEFLFDIMSAAYPENLADEIEEKDRAFYIILLVKNNIISSAEGARIIKTL